MRPRKINLSCCPVIPLALALAALPISCSSRSTTPFDPLAEQQLAGSASSRVLGAAELSSKGGFYPLAVGNRWHYTRIFTLDYHGLGADTIRTSTDRVDIGMETRSGRTYFVEQETSTQDSRPGEVFEFWTRYRQDRAGLYYFDLCACEPPTLEGISTAHQVVASTATPMANLLTGPSQRIPDEEKEAFHESFLQLTTRIDRMRRALAPSTAGFPRTSRTAAGADSDEITVLPFPLHVGKSWQIRPDLPLIWSVEGVEMLDTPAGTFPAYRIRVTFGGEGPEDFTRIWFGRVGQLAYRIHVVVPNGYPGAGWTADETEIVDRLSISR